MEKENKITIITEELRKQKVSMIIVIPVKAK